MILSSWHWLEERAAEPVIQERIREEILKGTIRVVPVRGGGIRIIPVRNPAPAPRPEPGGRIAYYRA